MTDQPTSLTSAFGPRGPAIEAMALRLVAVVESSDDLTVRARAWELADCLVATRSAQKCDDTWAAQPPRSPTFSESAPTLEP